AVIASGLSPADRVVTTGFANLSDGSKVIVGRSEQTPSADLAPRKRSLAPQGKDGQKDGQAKDGQASDNREAKEPPTKEQPIKEQPKDGEHRAKKQSGEGDQKGQTGPAQGAQPSGRGAKQP